VLTRRPRFVAGAPLEVRSTPVPDNPHQQRGHPKSIARAGPVKAVAELPRALSSQRVVRPRHHTRLLRPGAEVLARVR